MDSIHTEWDGPVRKHTSKCDKCNTKGHDIVYRCVKDSYAVCKECVDGSETGFDRSRVVHVFPARIVTLPEEADDALIGTIRGPVDQTQARTKRALSRRTRKGNAPGTNAGSKQKRMTESKMYENDGDDVPDDDEEEDFTFLHQSPYAPVSSPANLASGSSFSVPKTHGLSCHPCRTYGSGQML